MPLVAILSSSVTLSWEEFQWKYIAERLACVSVVYEFCRLRHDAWPHITTLGATQRNLGSSKIIRAQLFANRLFAANIACAMGEGW
jgi:hypothetical protein